MGLGNNWNPFKPFVRSRAEVAAILESVLNGTMHCHPWDDFICIPIKGAPEMEAVRAVCEELAPLEMIGDDGMVKHTPVARQRIERLLKGLRDDL